MAAVRNLLVISSLLVLANAPIRAEASYKVNNLTVLSILLGPQYQPYGTVSYLKWITSGQSVPGSVPHRSFAIPGYPRGTQIGVDGQCVAFARAVTGAPANGLNLDQGAWRRGKQVSLGGVPAGTMVATFSYRNGRYRYDGGHTAILIRYNNSKTDIDLWSQNWPLGFQCVVRHRIKKSDGSVGDPRRYYVVENP